MADLHGATRGGWIGVDLDGTLAFYDGWKGPTHIGDPVPKMLERVRKWVADGRTVKILTARVAPGKGDEQQCREAIAAWLARFGLSMLEVTHAKDHKMIELWDDRTVQVIPNTGERADSVSGLDGEVIGFDADLKTVTLRLPALPAGLTIGCRPSWNSTGQLNR